MAGLSRRFSEAGYDRPKYMLPLGGATCFDFSVAGFLPSGSEETFLFIVRDVHDTPRFVAERLDALGVERQRVVVLDRTTSGQGETVELGLAQVEARDGEELTIFNIDTFRRRVVPPSPDARGDGYLEVFVGSGDNWSFVDPLPGPEQRVRRTTEKVPVSDLCCTGLYHFRRVGDFREALAAERRQPTSALPETYVAPIYNQLIARGRDIRYALVAAGDVVFCGVPAEYEALRTAPERVAGFAASTAGRSKSHSE